MDTVLKNNIWMNQPDRINDKRPYIVFRYLTKESALVLVKTQFCHNLPEISS